MFTRLGFTYLPVTDLRQSISWYQTMLGAEFKHMFIDRPDYARSRVAVLHFPASDTTALLLFEAEDDNLHHFQRRGKKFPLFALGCKDIEATHQYLKSQGVAVEEIHTLGDNEAKYFYFRDLCGNYIEASWSIWDK